MFVFFSAKWIKCKCKRKRKEKILQISIIGQHLWFKKKRWVVVQVIFSNTLGSHALLEERNTSVNKNVSCEFRTRASEGRNWCFLSIRVCLHQASASMLWQLCDDANDSVLIEINGDTWKWVANPFWSVIGELFAALTLTLGVNGP